MKKILLIIDTPNRDMKGISLLTYQLIEKYSYFPIITTTTNELPCLIKYKPDLVLLPHVRYSRHQQLLEFALSQRTKIAILPTEGFPMDDSLMVKSLVGLKQFYSYIELLLTWGDYTKEYCEKESVLPNVEIITSGCPRFDFLTPKYNPIHRLKEQFCKEYQLDSNKPIISWFSSSTYANPKGGFDEWLKNATRSTGGGQFALGAFDFALMGKDHQYAYDYIMGLFKQLVQEYSYCSFIVKPHPGEPVEPYEESLGTYNNVRIIPRHEQTIELVRYCDVQLNWRCTTSLERWINDINGKVISIEPPDLQLSFSDRFLIGNDIVSTYAELKEKLDYYLSGGEVPSSLKEKRETFIKQYFRANDGSSSETTAEILHHFLKNQPRMVRTSKSYIMIAKYLYRCIRTRQWLGTIRKPGDIKYFSPEHFHQIVDSLNELFSTKISRDQYHLEI